MTEEKKLEPELRFSGFKDKWEKSKLGALGDFYRGNGLAKKDVEENGKYKCILYGELFTKYNEVINNIKSFTYKIPKNAIFSKKGDLLFPTSTTADAVSLINPSIVLEDYVLVGGDISILRPYKEKVSTLMLSYMINGTLREKIAKFAEGITIFHIYNKELKNVQIYLPSLLEQEKIGKFFYTIDKKLDLQREKIEKLKSYKKGMVQRIFDQEIRFKDENGKDYPNWEEKILGDVGEFYRGKGLAKEDIDLEAKNKCILYGELFTRYNEVINEIKSYTKVIPRNKMISKKFDLLFPTSTTASPVSLIQPSVILEKNVIIGGDISVFRPKREIVNTIYLSYIINNHLKYDIARYVEGITIYHIYSNELRNIKIKLPSLQEQEKIGDFLSVIDKKIELEEEKMGEFEKFKKGLMQRMFI